MEGVDKEKVQRIVYEMSKGSKYFQNEERKEAFIRHKIDNFRTQCARLTQADLSHYLKVFSIRLPPLPSTAWIFSNRGYYQILLYFKVF